MTLNSFAYSLPGEIDADLQREITAWRESQKVERIWQRDASVWSGSDEAKWLDWLGVAEEELSDLKKYRDLVTDIGDAGFRDILLLGMGGSSLCPEVLAMTFGKTNFQILDSTVPAQVKAVENKIDLEKTLFIVASKSGSTLEPNCFKQYFFERVSEKAGRENAGRQFIAITDPGSKLEQVARNDGFRHIFYGDPEIGGRFSALSVFGMTAAAAMGIDVEQFLQSAVEMVAACRRELRSSERGEATDDNQVQDNPGALLGLILGICHARGRDKLTIFTSPEIHDLGAWLEQLIAESTGKNGVSIIPVDREPIRDRHEYQNDRVFAFVTLKRDTGFDDEITKLEAVGHPVAKIELDSIETLGQEFFRWEFATAAAGSVMKINPFDQPDVESAKIEARKITDEYERTRELPGETPFFAADGLAFFTSDEYAAKLVGTAGEKTPASIIKAHLDEVRVHDYFALLAYVEMNADNESPLQDIRLKVSRSYQVATCLGFGPRFLHSTGQAYKGGANNGVFLQITADDELDLAVPEQKYSFGVVKSAQARGDFQVLIDRGRRALRVHIGKDVAGELSRLASII